MARSTQYADYELNDWYALEDAKRNIGTICRAVNVQQTRVYLGGSEGHPLLVLRDAGAVREDAEDVKFTIDAAKANWSSMTTAAMCFGTRFRIRSRSGERAVLYRHAENRHPALKYRRRTDRDLRGVVDKLEKALDELRNLRGIPDTLKVAVGELGRLCGELSTTNEIFRRRITELWRSSQNLPTMTSMHSNLVS